MRHATQLARFFPILLLAGCASGQPQSTSGSSPSQPAVSQTLVIGIRYEPATLAVKVLQSNGPKNATRSFNAALSVIDDKGEARPYLAESLPQLSTNAWKVLPDGRMETTYRLRDGTTWHDGAPLTADDFVFTFKVYKGSGLAVFISSPQDAIDTVQAPDPRTLIVSWKALNANAGSLGFEDLDPLPTHLFETPFNEFMEGRTTADAFLGNPLWASEYVGAGPFKLASWDPGVQLQGTAFEGHILGRPKFDRLVEKIILDDNTTIPAILAGDQVDYACCNTLRFDHYVTLKREWEALGKGTTVSTLGAAVFLFLQQRPEYVGNRALLDLRVRRALAHAIDRQALNDGLFDSLGAPTDTPVPPNVYFYPDVERLMTKYPLDANRSSQLMSEAGFTRDSQGFYVDSQGERFFVDFAVQAASEIERMQTLLSDIWRRAGFEVHTVVVGPQQYTQLETRHTLPGLGYAFFPTQGEQAFLSSQVGTAANRWAGNNRGAWTNPEYDRIYTAWNSTLDPAERGRDVAQLMALISENMPGYPLYFSQSVAAWRSGLRGVTTATDSSGFGQTARSTIAFWNIYEWSVK
ncbi:MAG TPA: ABC transporter substrate-binding protein [Chloroflexota bacterium]